MSVIGIVAEYNPFHLGHQFHIRRTLEQLGEDSTVVCVMSGDFVQRGEAACFSKFARAEAACRCGADLVIELPLPWCLSSAEGFARGAVYLLDALDCDAISFGSETHDLDDLQEIAERLVAPQFREDIRSFLDSHANMSYAAARQQVLSDQMGEKAHLLETPNNILAIEYLKAIRLLNVDLKPLNILRFGSGHDGTGGDLKSASELRSMLRADRSIAQDIPAEASAVFEREIRLGQDISRLDLLESAILSRLRMLPREAFEQLPDASDGLGQKLYQAAREETSLEALLSAVKSKRYALSRIRRMVYCAALGVKDGMAADLPSYARVLAANERGCEQLRLLRGRSIPIITKPASAHDLEEKGCRVFTLGAEAHDLLVLGCPSVDARRGGADWRTGPTIL